MKVKFLKVHAAYKVGDVADTTNKRAEYWERTGVAEVIKEEQEQTVYEQPEQEEYNEEEQTEGEGKVIGKRWRKGKKD